MSKKYRHLVTGGCSFTTTDVEGTWPLPVAVQLDLEIHNYAKISQGNNMIARSVVYGVNKLLSQGIDPDEILVGIIWSGYDRHEYFVDEFDVRLEAVNRNVSIAAPMPVDFVDNFQSGCWDIFNANFDTPEAIQYYTGPLYNEVSAVANTYERIHWVQQYLDNVGVDYFMSTYMNSVFESVHEDNPHVTWIRNMCEFDRFLPVRSYNWWFHPSDEPAWDHPNLEQALRFALKVIVPFIESGKCSKNPL